ncbi:hypothetical protein Ddc_14709 [Ditylenchus destructor]|nr:hypothetical protein Ddc_14709 [Ditylenchus destructor]
MFKAFVPLYVVFLFGLTYCDEEAFLKDVLKLESFCQLERCAAYGMDTVVCHNGHPVGDTCRRWNNYVYCSRDNCGIQPAQALSCLWKCAASHLSFNFVLAAILCLICLH